MAMLCGGALPLDAADLKHLWDFEGEQWRLDKVGMAHGTGTPETTLGTSAGAGGVGRALAVGGEISGADDHLVVDAAELYQPGISPFSVAFWIRMPDDGTSDPRGIFDFSANGRDGVQSLFIGASGELAFRIDLAGSEFVLAKATIDLEDGEWHSVAATYDPVDGLEVHIDGFGVDASAAPVPGAVAMASDCYLGSFNFTGDTATKGLAGDLDDLAVYAGVLSEAEISALAERDLPEFEIDSVRYIDGTVAITWPALEGEVFAVWISSDLEAWSELNDSVVAGADGGRYEYDVPDPQPERMFLQVRRSE